MKTAQQNHKKFGLAFKLSLMVLASTTVIFIAAFTYNYWYSNRMLFDQVQQNAENLTHSTVHQIETVLQGVQNLPLFLALRLESQPHDETAIKQSISDLVLTNKDVFGSAVAYEPFTFDPSTRFFAPYYYRLDGQLAYENLGNETYNYFEWDWYLIPKEMDTPIWTEPYYDVGGGKVIMSTYSVPFYKKVDEKKIFQGIVTADIALEWLVDIVSSISIYDHGFAFLISQNGKFVTHPDEDLIMEESIFSIAEARGDTTLRELGKKMVKGESGFAPYTSIQLNKQCWLCYAPLPSTQWSIGVVLPEDELFADLTALSRSVFIIGLAGFILLFLAIVIISGAITRPIRSLAKMTAEIAKGNLDVKLPSIRSSDEVGELSRSFDNMRTALKEYISNLTATTAAKERIESELKIAHTIQMNFLPKNFPPFPEHAEFDIYATLEPAKEVGGDLYDFFLLDDERLFFVIGDVTDKGVPAALFMAVSKTLIKGIAQHGQESNYSPSDILMRVNDELAIDNESSMFVTVICAELNFKTGRMRYSNAAHSSPVLIRNGKKPEWLELPGGFLCGPMEGTQYETREIILQPGDKILLYTDGVDEATNVKEEFYGKQRILDTIEANHSETAEELVKDAMAGVKTFAEGAPQADDITLVGLRYHGPK